MHTHDCHARSCAWPTVFGNPGIWSVDVTNNGVHFGSYSLVVQPVADAFATFAAAAGGRFVSLDPNVRPTVEPDLDIWRSRVAEYAAFTDLLKISSEDLAFLYPDVPAANKAADWMDAGVKLVVVTDGSNDVAAWTSTGCTMRAKPPLGDVIDTVGAGDSFQSALLARVATFGDPKAVVSSLDRDRFRIVLNYALRAASITCSRRGADLPHSHELPESDR